MKHALAPAALAALLAACGPSPYADISGTVAGSSFSANTYFWGGPYLVFVDKPQECIDLYWIRRGGTFQTGDEPPVDTDQRVLLFTYDESEVATGDYSLEGDAPVDGRLLDISGGAMTVYKATTGDLRVDEITKKDHAIGSFELGFDDGSLSGDFEIAWCNNLKART